jgi:hypothetical protein
MDNIFKISTESVIELVKKLITNKPGKCCIYNTSFQSSKYVFSNIPKGVTIKVSDSQEQTYGITHKKSIVAKLDNKKHYWEALKIDADQDVEIYVEAVIDNTCKTENVIQTPIKFWSTVAGIIPWKFSISNVRETKFPKYYVSYGKTNEAKSKYEISEKDYCEMISLLKTVINEENRQKNINKQLIIDKQNSEILNDLLEANKIEKKL